MIGSSLLAIAAALWIWPAARRAGSAGRLDPRGWWLRAVPNEPSRRWVLAAAIGVGTAASFAAPWHAAVCAGVFVAVAAQSWRDARGRRTRAARAEHDVEALQALAAELRAGSDLIAALASAGTIAETSMCRGMIRAAQAIRVGDDAAASLQRAGEGELDRLAGLVRLSGAYGIALAEAIDVLAADATDGVHARRDVASLLAGPRATAALLTLLPAFGLIMGQTIGAEPWRVLLHTNAGAIAMVAGTALAAAGVLWTHAMVRKAES